MATFGLRLAWHLNASQSVLEDQEKQQFNGYKQPVAVVEGMQEEWCGRNALVPILHWSQGRYHFHLSCNCARTRK